MSKRWRMDLTMFGDEQGAAAAAPAEAAPAEQGTGTDTNAGVNALPAGDSARKQKVFPAVEKIDVRRNTAMRTQPATAPQMTQTAPQQTAQEPAQEQPAADPDKEFNDLIRGKYSKQANNFVQGVLKERFKNQADLGAKLKAQEALIAQIAQNYGIEANENGEYDIDAMTNKVKTDTRLYEDEALKLGIPVETLMENSHLKAERKQQEINKRREEYQRQQSLDAELDARHLAGLREQETEMKKTFPDFDLYKEAMNPKFRNMTSRNGGLSVEEAYMAIHGREIMKNAAMAAAHRTEEQTKANYSRSIQSGTMRVQENGLMQSGGGAPQRDPHSWTKAERAENRRRVKNGEHVIV